MSNTINTNSPANYTVALDDNDRILWCSQATSLNEGIIYNAAPTATSVIIGTNVEELQNAIKTHTNITKVYYYNEETEDIIYEGNRSENQDDESTNTIYNALGNEVEVSPLDEEDYVFGLYENYADDSEYVNVSDFLTGADVYNNASGAINLAILYALTENKKVFFEGDKTYVISNPIVICPNSSDSEEYNNFEVDFNHCKITTSNTSHTTVENENNETITVVTDEPIFTPYIDGEGNEINTMIYVSSNFADSENPDIIKNLQLCSTNKCTNEIIAGDENNANSSSSTVYEHGIETGIYVDGSSNVKFENIKIMDTKRGVYVSPDSHDIIMDNIHISKTRVNGASLLDFPESEDGVLPERVSSEIADNYSNSKNVGVDCYASNCYLSNIVVIDSLIGMRVMGENNNMYGVHIWNTYCPEQYKYSVGFINGGNNSTSETSENVYTACVADKFYIGWLSSDTSPFTLTNCHWLNKQVDFYIIINGNRVRKICGNEAYGFFIPDGVVCDDGKIGSNITINDCYMVGSDLDNDECFTNFCNQKNHSIEYTGAIENTFYAPIPEMRKFEASQNNIHDCQNNSTINQYGKIRPISKIFEKTATNPWDVYRLDVSDFDFANYENANREVSDDGNSVTIKNLAFLDLVKRKNGGTGTIINMANTATTYTRYKDNSEVFNEIELSIKASENVGTGWNQIQIDLKDLGYKAGDICWLTFDYYTKRERENGAPYQVKHVFLDDYTNYVNYYTDEPVVNQSIPLTECDSDTIQWTPFDIKFKLKSVGSKLRVTIGHGGKNSSDFNTNPIIIRKLRFVKLNELPKYYLETEENYKERVLKFWDTFTYDLDSFTIPAYNNSENTNLSFISLPFKQTITDNQDIANVPEYKLSYSKLGTPRFSGNIIENDESVNGGTIVNPVINIEYNTDEVSKLYVLANSKYPSYSLGVNSERPLFDIIANGNENQKYSYKYWNYYQDWTVGANVPMNTRINLPCYNCEEIEEPYLITNFIVNPYGYYDELPVEAEYNEDNTSKQVGIPLYKNGEVRLMMKNAEYSTDLPTFDIDVEYLSLEENNS